MENFVVSARKYRPTVFDEVVGQQSITRTLENAIKNNHLAQAFLFCGPRGVGKTTCARILAKVVNQAESDEFKEDEDFAFNIFELDAASNNGVDDIRSLNEQVRITPQIGKYKVYIIDEVHMLTQSAFNAFLKTLEEPPPHAIFILATTEKHKIIPTVLSRCQIFDFKRIEIKDIVSHLKGIAENQKVNIEEDALHIIAQKADGALRDALSIFDQVVSFSGNEVKYKDVIQNLNVLDYDYYFQIAQSMLEGNIPNALLFFNEILQKGFDGHNFINGLASHLRDLLVCKTPETIHLLEVGEAIKKRYYEQANLCQEAFLLEALKKCSECDVNYRTSKNQRLLVEFTLMQLCKLVEKKNDNTEVESYIPQPALTSSLPSQNQPIYIDNSSEKDGLNSPKTQSEPKKVEGKKPTLETQTVEETIESSIVAEPEPLKSLPTDLDRPVIVRNKSRRKSKNSLSHLMGKQTVEEEVVEEDPNAPQEGPSTEFSHDELIQAFKEYVDLLKELGKGSFAGTLGKRDPILKEDFKVVIKIDNTTEEIELKTERIGLLKYLRDKLKNNRISIHSEMVESKDEKLIYTNSDKYKKLVELHPKVKDLADLLGLRPD